MTQGRHNVHGKGGLRFKTPYTSSKHKAMLRNVVTELIVKEKVTVTSGVVKDLKKVADRLVGYAKKGDLHSRRLAAAVVRNVDADKEGKTSALDKLFSDLGKRFAKRNGGYTCSYKLNERRGDGASLVIVEWAK